MIINSCTYKNNSKQSLQTQKKKNTFSLTGCVNQNSLADNISFSSSINAVKKIYNQTVTDKLVKLCENYEYANIIHPWGLRKWFCCKIERLVKKGADPNIIINDAPEMAIKGDNILDVVLFCDDSPKTIRCLLDHGAKTDHINDLGYNVLRFAESKGRKKSAEVIRNWQLTHS